MSNLQEYESEYYGHVQIDQDAHHRITKVEYV